MFKIDARSEILGLHRILPIAFAGGDLTGLWAERIARVTADAADGAAMMDLSMMMQSHGRTEEALGLLAEALKVRRDFCVVHGDGSGVRLLAFVTAGDFMANTPVDFLLGGSNAVLWLHYVDEHTASLDNLPEHDIALFAISEANGHPPVLARMAELLPRYGRPVLNGDPALIASLTRDGVSALFADEPSILVPRTHRITRTALEAIAAGRDTLGGYVAGLDFPVIVRPIGTHAGFGLDRARDAAELATYLQGEPGADFYVAPFVDYSGPDGLFSKQRVAVIGGRPFASHLALSDHWIVHYLSAGMTEDAAKRAIEAEWMATFDEGFARRHAAAFDALNRHFGLDYYGIDCAELPDGRLLVFESDIAMVVHDMDDATIFPYKKVAMQKLFDAFVAMLETAAAPALVQAA